MKEFPKNPRSWIDAIEKILIIFTLLATLFKGCEFITEKTAQSAALKKETEKRTESIDILTNTYVKQLNDIDADIRKLDEAIQKEPWSTTTGAVNMYRLRQEKVKDKQELLKELGNQIIELKKFSIGKR